MVRAADERSKLFYIGCIGWLLSVVVLVKHNFGVVAAVLTVFLGIWNFGLREKFSNEETASAYSVFNQNQQAIAGSYTADQLDRQLRGGLGKKDTISSIPVASRVKQTKRIEIKETERLRRRNAAAEAAERRLQMQKEDDDKDK